MLLTVEPTPHNCGAGAVATTVLETLVSLARPALVRPSTAAIRTSWTGAQVGHPTVICSHPGGLARPGPPNKQEASFSKMHYPGQRHKIQVPEVLRGCPSLAWYVPTGPVRRLTADYEPY